VVARVLHVLSPVTAFPDASSILTYVFGLFCFFLFTVCLCDAQMLRDCLLAYVLDLPSFIC
jgi:hypothetical protein